MQEKEINIKTKHLFKRFISYYRPYKKTFVLDMLASFMISAIAMVYPVVTQLLTKDYIPNADFTMIWIFGGVILFLYICRLLLRYFVQYHGHVMGVKMQGQMRTDMFRHLEKLPYSYYDEHETGKIMSRMTNDLQDVSELAHHGPENFFISGMMIVATFAYLMYLNVYLTLIIFCVVPMAVLISVVLKKSMSSAFMESRKSVAIINGNLQNSISGIRVTKAFNNALKEEEKFEVGNQSFITAKSKAYKAMGKFQSSTAFVTDLFNLVVLIAGALFMAQGIFSYDVFAAFIVSINLFINPLTTLINFTEQFENGVTGFKRFVTIMDEPIEADDENSVNLGKSKGHIEFKDVSFGYEEGETVLNHISLDIKTGEKLALVGPSGGGKTTICHLIPGFYKGYTGHILIDGIDNKKITLSSLRNNIGIVQQDVFLFNGTIGENILYGRLDATYDEMVEASKKARIYDYVCTLKDGFDTQIGERGVKLSGGQKQRLSIARVFLKNPAILILDEATSALDNTTEILIQEALDELCKGRTTLVVAHRLSTIKNATKIVVISEGVIKEYGSHEELIAKENGIYHQLYDLQFRVNETIKNLDLSIN